MKVGIALGSGGLKGSAHIGVLRACEDLGISPSYISGASVGALIGALYASGIPAKELKKIVSNFSSLKKFLPYTKFSLPTKGLLSPFGISLYLKEIIGEKTPKELPKKLFIVATNLQEGKREVLEDIPVYLAVSASIAVPGIFHPVEINGKIYADGGITASLPIKELKTEKLDIIIASSLRNVKMYIEKYELSFLHKTITPRVKEFLKRIANIDVDIENFNNTKKKISLTSLTSTVINIMARTIEDAEIEIYKPDIVIRPTIKRVTIFNIHELEEIEEQAYRQAREILEEYFNKGI